MKETEIILPILTIFVTIIGFIITILLNKKQIDAGLSQIKNQKKIEILSNVPIVLLVWVHELIKEYSNDVKIDREKYLSIISTTLAYGSTKTAEISGKLLLYLQNYGAWSKEVRIGSDLISVIIANILLLISMIKAELTGETVDPIDFITYAEKTSLGELGFDNIAASVCDAVDNNSIDSRYKQKAEASVADYIR